jgi:AraC-like DNA-binding protein
MIGNGRLQGIHVMDDVDALIRGAAIGVMLLMAAVFLRTWRKVHLGWIGTLFAAGAVGYLLWGHQAISDWPPLARLVVGVFALSTTFFFWALARLIFDDEFRLRPAHWAILAAIVVAGVAQSVLPGIRFPWLPGALRVGFRLISLALIAHVVWLVWCGWPADLIERRARLRLAFLGGTAIIAALVVLAALIYAPAAARPPAVRLGEAIAFTVFSLGLALALVRSDRDLGPRETAPAASIELLEKTDRADGSRQAGADADLLARLNAVMRQDEVWRETGLTIGGLAERAGIPEYRLRRLINQRLGFRNFTAFLNEYRLSAAAARLAERANARVPVLTIALDLGWGSIGPFNRAFRARFGITPTDYRRRQEFGPPPNA